jgi:hypothetical protein
MSMAPKPITESDPAGQDTALPQEIIAQAEAAVAGNALVNWRRPSQAKSGSSRQQQDLHQTSDSGNEPGLASEIQPAIDKLVS